MSDLQKKLAAAWAQVQAKTATLPEYVGAEWNKITKEADSFLGLQDKEFLKDGVYFFQHSFLPFWVDNWAQAVVDLVGQRGSGLVAVQNDQQRLAIVEAVAAAALANQKNCLLVARDEAEAAALMTALQRRGLGAQLKNSSWQPTASAPLPLPTNLTRLLRAAASQIQQWNAAAQLYQTPIGQCEDVADAIPLLNENQIIIAGLERLEAPQDAHFERICQEGERLWENVALPSPFASLHPRFYRQPDGQQLAAQLQNTLQRMLQAVEEAQRDALTYLFQYEKSLSDHFTDIYAQKLALLRQIHSACELAEKKSSKILSPPHPKTHETQTAVFALHDQLYQLHFKYLYIPHEFEPLQRQMVATKTLRENLQTYEDQLTQWYHLREDFIQGHLLNLSEAQLDPHSPLSPKIRATLLGLNMLCQNINKAEVFQNELRLQQPSIKNQLQTLADFSQNIKNLLQIWPQFVSFHAAEYFVQAQNPTTQKWLRALYGQKNWASLANQQIIRSQLVQRRQHPDWRKGQQLAQLLALAEENAKAYRTELQHFINSNSQAGICIATPQQAQNLPCHLALFDLVAFPFADQMTTLEALPMRFRARHCLALSQNMPQNDDYFLHFWAHNRPVAQLNTLAPFQPKSFYEYASQIIQKIHPNAKITSNKIIDCQHFILNIPIYIEAEGRPKALFFSPIAAPAGTDSYGWETTIGLRLPEPIEPLISPLDVWLDNPQSAAQRLLQ